VNKVAKTVSELIEILREMPPETVPYGPEPPFTGVAVGDPHEGKVGIFSMRDTPEGRALMHEKNRPVAAQERTAE